MMSKERVFDVRTAVVEVVQAQINILICLLLFVPNCVHYGYL